MILPLRLVEVGLYAAVFASVYFFGATLPDGYAFLEASILLLGIGVVLIAGFKKERSVSSGFLIVMSLAILWILFLRFQSATLPTAWVARLSPKLINLWNSFSEPRRASSNFIPLAAASAESMWLNLGKSIAYAGMFLIAYSVSRDALSFRRFGNVILLLGTSTSVAGIFFHRFFPGMLYGLFRFEGGAPFTPYLNKNQFANLLVMTLPVTAAAALWNVQRSSFSIQSSVRKKILWFASPEATPFYAVLGCFMLQLTALFCSASRGGLLGIAVGFLFFVSLIFIRARRKSAAALLIGAICFFLAAGVFQAKPLLAKFRVLKNAPLQDDAVYFRVTNWKDTLRMFSDFPVLGVGAGGFHEIFPLYKTLPNKAEYTQVLFFHADNEYLELLAETGLAGAVILGLFAVVLAGGFLREWHRVESRTLFWFPLGVFSGSVGMLAHSAVDFSTHVPANMALFSAYGGFLARFSLGGRSLSQPDALGISESRSVSTVRFLKAGASLAASVLLVAVFGSFLWRQWNSDRLFLKGQAYIEKIAKSGSITLSDTTAAQEYLLKAKRYGAGESRIDHALGRALLYRALLYEKTSRKREMLLREAEQTLRKPLEREPLNALYHYSLGYLYERWGKFADAANHFEKAARLEPMNPFYRFRHGENQVRLKSNSSALKAFKEAVKINHVYLEPVLKIAEESSLALSERDFRDFVTGSTNPSVIQSRLASFYELREDHTRAALIRHFTAERS